MCDRKEIWEKFLTANDFDGCEFADEIYSFVKSEPTLLNSLFSTTGALRSLKALSKALHDFSISCGCLSEEEELDYGCVLPRAAYEIDGAYLDYPRPPPVTVVTRAENPAFFAQFAVMAKNSGNMFGLCSACSEEQFEEILNANKKEKKYLCRPTLRQALVQPETKKKKRAFLF